MTALRPEIAETQADEAGPADQQGPALVGLHESIAALLASRGQWRQAYQHLRSALDLVHADQVEEPHVPEQLRREVDRLRREHAEAREQSLRDSLTDSYNRRYLDQRLMDLHVGQTHRVQIRAMRGPLWPLGHMTTRQSRLVDVVRVHLPVPLARFADRPHHHSRLVGMTGQGARAESTVFARREQFVPPSLKNRPPMPRPLPLFR